MQNSKSRNQNPSNARKKKLAENLDGFHGLFFRLHSGSVKIPFGENVQGRVSER
jgi:hypothetical protein